MLSLTCGKRSLNSGGVASIRSRVYMSSEGATPHSWPARTRSRLRGESSHTIKGSFGTTKEVQPQKVESQRVVLTIQLHGVHILLVDPRPIFLVRKAFVELPAPVKPDHQHHQCQIPDAQSTVCTQSACVCMQGFTSDMLRQPWRHLTHLNRSCASSLMLLHKRSPRNSSIKKKPRDFICSCHQQSARNQNSVEIVEDRPY